jgi:hypothetical protein
MAAGEKGVPIQKRLFSMGAISHQLSAVSESQEKQALG